MITLIVCATIILSLMWSMIMLAVGFKVAEKSIIHVAAHALRDQENKNKALAGQIKTYQDRINKMVGRANEQGQLIAKLKEEIETLKPSAPINL